MRVKALGMISGGLDSSLAAQLLMDLGVAVEGLKFITGFSPLVYPEELQKKDPSAKPRFKIHTINISMDFLPVVRHPKYGYGSNLNPCVDCKIFMLQQAKRFMKEFGAQFVFTGEVLGQRPMSQFREALKRIEIDSGLAGYLLRPLSAKLLDPTVPEVKGWVDRHRLLDIQGRSRKPQIQLAKEMDLSKYAQPAGGCLLADANYCVRLKALFAFRKDAPVLPEDLELLKIGRLFHISDTVRLIVGRNQNENELLMSYAHHGRHLFVIHNYPSPAGLAEIVGEAAEKDLTLLASIVAHYSDAQEKKGVIVEHSHHNKKANLISEFVETRLLNAWRI